MVVVYRDKRGVEYESVPLPTNEVTDAVPLDAHIVSKRVVRKPLPIYEGTDGEQLARAPRSQRRNWTDEQWGAYEEHRRLKADQSKDDAPVASVVVIRSEREGPTGQALAGGLPDVPRVAHTRSLRAPFGDTCQRSIPVSEMSDNGNWTKPLRGRRRIDPPPLRRPARSSGRRSPS